MSVFSRGFNCFINDIFDATNRFNNGLVSKEILEKQIRNYLSSYLPNAVEFEDLLVAYRNDPEITSMLIAAKAGEAS